MDVWRIDTIRSPSLERGCDRVVDQAKRGTRVYSDRTQAPAELQRHLSVELASVTAEHKKPSMRASRHGQRAATVTGEVGVTSLAFGKLCAQYQHASVQVRAKTRPVFATARSTRWKYSYCSSSASA